MFERGLSKIIMGFDPINNVTRQISAQICLKGDCGRSGDPCCKEEVDNTFLGFQCGANICSNMFERGLSKFSNEM